tara:strand:+ start:270 stop:497 length:228 start_codon:yes stop_codon:yes gene_type:complete
MTYLIIDLPKTFTAYDVELKKEVTYEQPMEWAVIVDKDGNAFYATGCYLKGNKGIDPDTKTWKQGSSFGKAITAK